MKTYEKYLVEKTVKIGGMRAKPIPKKHQGMPLARGMDVRNMGDYYIYKDGKWQPISADVVEGVNEAVKTNMQCMECGKKFKKSIGPKTYEVKCPKCGSYDTEPA